MRKATKLVLLGTILFYSSFSFSNEPSVALGCKGISPPSLASNFYAFFYSAPHQTSSYNKICIDTLGGTQTDPIICDSKRSYTNSKEVYSFNLRLVIDRQTLVARRYGIKYHPCTGMDDARNSFNTTCGQYQCEVSPNAAGTLNAVQREKKKELSLNKI